MKLFWRVYLWLFACAVVAIALAGGHANRTLRRLYLEQIAAELRTQAEWVAGELQAVSAALDSGWVDRRCKELGGSSAVRVTVVLPEGRVIGDSKADPGTMENHGNRPEIAAALAGRTGHSERFSDTLRRTLAYLAVPVVREGRVVGAVRTALPLADIDRELQAAHREVALGVLGAALLFALVAWVLVRRITRPLEEMEAVAVRLAAGDLQARVPPPSGGREMRALARALNEMAGQLEGRLSTITNQSRELAAVLASMSEGVLAVDSGGRILHINAAAAEQLGLAGEPARGRPVEEIVRHADLHRFIRGIQAGGRGGELELAAPGERFLRLQGTPLEDAAGRQIGVLVVMSDTTRLKRLEQMRQDFVANVSHELKTPITALRAGVDTLLDSERSAEDRHFIEMMGRQIHRLGAIVGDLLSLSRLEHDEQNGRVVREPGPVRDVLRRAAAALAKPAENKRIAITVECPEGLQASINAPLLEQAVTNLIDNAVKYSGEGARVEVAAEPFNGEGVAIRVKDNGPGIEQRHLPRIFERFYRVDQARSRALGGTGLGLAIVKHIARAHGGTVAVESTPGSGSVFTLRLPRK